MHSCKVRIYNRMINICEKLNLIQLQTGTFGFHLPVNKLHVSMDIELDYAALVLTVNIVMGGAATAYLCYESPWSGEVD